MQYNHVVHHGDDDGYCAAAIIIGQCIPTTVSEDRTFSYWHGDEVPAIQYDKVTETDRLFILDLALDDVMLGIIRKFREAAPKGTIIHIDHHKSTFEKLNALSPEDKELMSSVIQYYRIGLSGCLLAWIWTSMHEDEQQHPDDVPFDFMPQMTHVGLWPEGYGGHEERLYPIPSIVRWINDWDVWTHELPDTTEFHYGFMLEDNKSPFNKDLWSGALYDRNIEYLLHQLYVGPGRTILQYINEINKSALERAFEDEIMWKNEAGQWTTEKILMLNATGNSMVFGDKIKEYPAVMLWHYNGKTHQYHYSLYSHEGGLDVSVIAKYYGGGGHAHAAGFQSDLSAMGLYGDSLFEMEREREQDK